MTIRTAPLLPVAVSLLAGTATGFCFPAAPWQWPLLAMLVVMAALGRRWPLAQSALLLAAMATLGMLLAGQKEMEAQRWDYDAHERKTELIVASEPAEKPRSVAFDALQASDGRLLKCYMGKDSLSLRLKPGDALLAHSRIQPLSDFRDGSFSYARYLMEHGFSGRCWVGRGQWAACKPTLQSLSVTDRSRLRFLRWRHELLGRYHAVATGDAYAVMAAMTLGDKTTLSPALRQAYAASGAAHVLALSGLHLGILYFMLSFLFLGRRRAAWLAQALLVVALWAFVLLVGMPVSMVRSAVMLTMLLLFAGRGLQQASVNVLCLAAIVLLVANPFALHDVGFQLSFASVLSILLLMPKFEALIGREWLQHHRWARALFGCLAVSVAAQVGTAPLVAYYFHQLPLCFLLTNLVVMPAAYLVLCGSLLLLLLPCPPVAQAVVWVVEMLNSLLSCLAAMPGATISGLRLNAIQAVLCYVVIITVMEWAFFRKNRFAGFRRPSNK